MTRVLTPVLLLTLLLLALSAGGLEAAAQPADGGRSMRHFWHVFIAYAAAWLILLGWIFAIIRRIARVERRLGR